MGLCEKAPVGKNGHIPCASARNIQPACYESIYSKMVASATQNWDPPMLNELPAIPGYTLFDEQELRYISCLNLAAHSTDS